MSLKNYNGTTGYFVNTADVVSAGITKDSSANLFCLYVIGTSLYCRKSASGGVNWEDAVTVVTESYSGADGIEFDAGIDSNNDIQVVYTVRTGVSGSVRTMYHIIRDGATGTWGTKADVIGATGYYKFPHLAIDSSDNIHVVFFNTATTGRVSYVKYSASAWSAITNITSKTSRDISSQDIAVDSSGNIHIVYGGASTSDRNLYYRIYSGGAWQAEETLAGFSDSANWQIEPAIAIDSSNNVHVVWSGKNYGVTNPTISQVCYITGTTGAWGAVTLLTDKSQPQGDTYGLAIAINDLDEIDVVWAGSQWSSTAAWITANKITYSSGAWGSVSVLSDYNISGVFGMLWAKYPAQCSLASSFIALTTGRPLGATGSIYQIAIIQTRFHYTDAYGTQRYLEGTPV